MLGASGLQNLPPYAAVAVMVWAAVAAAMKPRVQLQRRVLLTAASLFILDHVGLMRVQE
ncbi:hypothetical protein [Antarcticirhabdus aurantiaca]|uniref:hypothetical protein n=1 Tax=Antarcticirhabdus aurantiaca TaxID=2606717 RepID=UPI00131ADF1E|nr:hypothetical protein [Antarcticirhabdus aurantiaca]